MQNVIYLLLRRMRLPLIVIILTYAISILGLVLIPLLLCCAPLSAATPEEELAAKVLKETGWIQGTIDGPRVCYCTVGGIMEVYLSLLNRAFTPLPRDLDPLSEEIVEEGSDA